MSIMVFSVPVMPGGGDQPHVPHGLLGGGTVDAMDRVDRDALHCHGDRPVGGVHRHHALHGAALIAAVADHSGDAAGHVADGPRHGVCIAVPQKDKAAGHAGARRDGAAAECRQLARILLDVHTDQIAQGGGAQQFLLRISLYLTGGVEGHGGDDPMRPRPGDAHSRLGQAQDPGFNGSVAEQGSGGLFVPGNEPAAVFGQQIAGIGGFGAVQARFAEGQIHLEGAPDEGDLAGRHGEGVIPQLCQGVAVDQGGRRRRRPERLPGPAFQRRYGRSR